MAQPKSRARRSSSSTSYTSTLTTLIFTALCVLGIWMLTSNSVVTPKTRTPIDDNNSETTNTDLVEDTPETTTTTTTNIIQQDDPVETTTHIAEDSSRETTTNIPEEPHETTTNISEEPRETTTNTAEEPRETTTNISEEPRETTTNISEEPRETTTNILEESSESNTKSHGQRESDIYGDNAGNLSDDAMANEGGNTVKKEVSTENKVGAGSDNDQKSDNSEKEAQSVQASEEDQKGEEENNNVTQDEKENLNTKQNAEAKNVNMKENQEESMSDDQQSFDVQKGKNNDDDANVQQLREDKGEVTEKEEKTRVEDEGGEKKKVKNMRKWGQILKKEWPTQGDESEVEKKRQKEELGGGNDEVKLQDLNWSICNVSTGHDYIPCLDNEKYLKTSTRKHFVHRERHCPEDAPTCLVPLPKGYKIPIQWPASRDKIWYHNIPHTLLADVKGHQNWVKLKGEFLTFPGGGTQFIHGALHYIDFLQQAEPGIAWGTHTRVILDVGCGVGSFGGFLFERDVIAMSFAPKDEHEAQVQFALERGIPAISAVMGTQRLQFPSQVFDLIHCARCRVPWHEDGGMLLLELNRLLRPGGYFVWCATPVYQTIEEDAQIWKQMSVLTKAICWELVSIKKDKLNQVGAAFYRKPLTNECYEQREQNQPPMCKAEDDPNAAWYVPLQACMHKLPVDNERGTKWPEAWPERLQKVPDWLQASQDFAADNERWKNVVDELSNIGVSWSNVRNIMDMRASCGGFAAALKDLPVWVFNVVNIDAVDTLPLIYERGLIGIYHDWCESFSTYPRTYDLLHADHLFSNLMKRCNLVPVIAEVDRILRPGGNLIVRDEPSVIGEVENLLKSLHWEITSTSQEGLLNGKKAMWRPTS
ncbi:probable methyltransferase PMT27 [Phaseolus vulgaris]|uniref:probable methyltransferase PMT27 n=1 Tax=Phaseolus vulgaris TaxID=3885 RepID=UPI0035CC9680